MGKHWHIKACYASSPLIWQLSPGHLFPCFRGEREPANQISHLMDRDEERRREERVIVVVMNLQDDAIVFFMNEGREIVEEEKRLVVWVILSSGELFQRCITNDSGPPTTSFSSDLGQVTLAPAVLQCCIRFHITSVMKSFAWVTKEFWYWHKHTRRYTV